MQLDVVCLPRGCSEEKKTSLSDQSSALDFCKSGRCVSPLDESPAVQLGSAPRQVIFFSFSDFIFFVNFS